jgi:hypothetical protein
MDDKDSFGNSNRSRTGQFQKRGTFQKGSEATRKNAHKAGIASGKRRREIRSMKDDALTLLSLPLHPGKIMSIEQLKSLHDVGDSNLTMQQQIILNAVNLALKSDKVETIVRVLEFLRDSSGQKPTNHQESVVSMPVDLNIVQRMVESIGDDLQKPPEGLDDGIADGNTQ